MKENIMFLSFVVILLISVWRTVIFLVHKKSIIMVVFNHRKNTNADITSFTSNTLNFKNLYTYFCYGVIKNHGISFIWMAIQLANRKWYPRVIKTIEFETFYKTYSLEILLIVFCTSQYIFKVLLKYASLHPLNDEV